MKTLPTLFCCFTTSVLSAQTPIDVTDQTVKIGAMKEELLYFGFAEGDQIVFNFTEVDGKELKELEVSEYPSVSKYADFKTARIENKTIAVDRQAVYQFRFYNGAAIGRVCRIHIQRIPASEQTKRFSTRVTWTSKQDTTWNTYTKDVLVRYDTIYRQLSRKELVKTTKNEVFLLERTEQVHTELNAAGNKASVFFTLPAPQYGLYQTSRVVAWAYWVGVGHEGQNAWQQNADNIAGLASEAAATFTTPLGALAVGVVARLLIPQGGDNAYYALTDVTNKNLFMAGQGCKAFDYGNGTAGYKQFVDPDMCSGSYFILLSNDNYMDPIDVHVKIVAIVETDLYEDRLYTEEVLKPLYEKRIFSDPVITTRTVPVIGI